MKKNKTDKSYIFTKETMGMTVLLFSTLILIILLTRDTVFLGLGTSICHFLYGAFGYGSYLLVASAYLLGIKLLFGKSIKIRLRSLLSLSCTVYVLFLLFHAITTQNFPFNGYGNYLNSCFDSGLNGISGSTFGGVVSALAVYPIAYATTYVGAYIIFSILAVLTGYISFITLAHIKISRHISLFSYDANASEEDNGDDVADVQQNQPTVNQSADTVNQPTVRAAMPRMEDTQPAYNTNADIMPRITRGFETDTLGEENDVLQTEQAVADVTDERASRKIIFDNNEFAAESYRTNMLFKGDSYFNRPVANTDADYLKGFAPPGGKVYSVPDSRGNEQQPVVMVNSSNAGSRENAVERQTVPVGSYLNSYENEMSQSQSVNSPIRRTIDNSAQVIDSFTNIDTTVFTANRDSEDVVEEPVVDDTSVSYQYGEEFYDDFSDSDDEQFLNEEEQTEENYQAESEENFSADTNQQQIRNDAQQSETQRTFNRGIQPDNGGTFNRGVQPDNGGTFNHGIQPDNGGTLNRGIQPDGDRTLNRGVQPDNGRGGRSIISGLFSSDNSSIGSGLTIEPNRNLLDRTSRRHEESNVNLFDNDDEEDVAEEPVMDDVNDDINDGFDDDYNFDDDTTNDKPAINEVKPVRFTGGNSTQSESVRNVSVPQPQNAEPKEKHVWKPYVRPPINLLNDYDENSIIDYEEIEQNKRAIVDILTSAKYKIACTVSDPTIGPTFLRYDVIISDMTKIKEALAARDSIALAMRSNINAYINFPKGALSIEVPVPDEKRGIIGLKGILQSDIFARGSKNSITFGLGKNADGNIVCPDLAKMPHLLIAGSSGSGKSICINALILSLLYKYSPEELRLILVDPKLVEFIPFDKLPHLMINEIIETPEKALMALNWTIAEMQRRYTLFKELSESGKVTKSLEEYNKNISPDEEKLPKIVVILDEFGDLMANNKKDIENKIIILSQKARACGIHLILATQRPSVDVITGLIKSNLQARIGFKVGSFDDSRTIFDQGGAEKLCGRGDLYYRSATSPELTRLQCCYASSEEVHAVTSFIKANNETYFDQSVSDFINKQDSQESNESVSDKSADNDNKIDEKYIKALKFCIMSGQASVSRLQRRFPIGYTKACKIIDWMTRMNYIPCGEGPKARDVYISMEEFIKIYGDIDID